QRDLAAAPGDEFRNQWHHRIDHAVEVHGEHLPRLLLALMIASRAGTDAGGGDHQIDGCRHVDLVDPTRHSGAVGYVDERPLHLRPSRAARNNHGIEARRIAPRERKIGVRRSVSKSQRLAYSAASTSDEKRSRSLHRLACYRAGLSIKRRASAKALSSAVA